MARMLATGIAVLVLVACGSNSSSSAKVIVSSGCEQAWADYEAATTDPAANADDEATATLTECHSSAEWKKAAEPYQGGILPAAHNKAGVSIDDILDGFCVDNDTTSVCAGR